MRRRPAARKITKVIFLIHYSMIVAVRFMNRRPATRKITKVIFLIHYSIHSGVLSFEIVSQGGKCEKTAEKYPRRAPWIEARFFQLIGVISRPPGRAHFRHFGWNAH